MTFHICAPGAASVAAERNGDMPFLCGMAEDGISASKHGRSGGAVFLCSAVLYALSSISHAFGAKRRLGGRGHSCVARAVERRYGGRVKATISGQRRGGTFGGAWRDAATWRFLVSRTGRGVVGSGRGASCRKKQFDAERLWRWRGISICSPLRVLPPGLCHMPRQGTSISACASPRHLRCALPITWAWRVAGDGGRTRDGGWADGRGQRRSARPRSFPQRASAALRRLPQYNIPGAPPSLIHRLLLDASCLSRFHWVFPICCPARTALWIPPSRLPLLTTAALLRNGGCHHARPRSLVCSSCSCTRRTCTVLYTFFLARLGWHPCAGAAAILLWAWRCGRALQVCAYRHRRLGCGGFAGVAHHCNGAIACGTCVAGETTRGGAVRLPRRRAPAKPVSLCWQPPTRSPQSSNAARAVAQRGVACGAERARAALAWTSPLLRNHCRTRCISSCAERIICGGRWALRQAALPHTRLQGAACGYYISRGLPSVTVDVSSFMAKPLLCSVHSPACLCGMRVAIGRRLFMLRGTRRFLSASSLRYLLNSCPWRIVWRALSSFFACLIRAGVPRSR